MAKEPTAKEPKKLKLPKSLGACVDLYHGMRAKRLLANKDVEAMKAQETEVSNHIIDNLSKKDEGGAVGALYRGTIVEETVYQVNDWDKFYAHLKKTGEFDLLNRALNQAAVKARVADQVRPTGKRGEKWTPKLPPGITTFNALKLSVTKK